MWQLQQLEVQAPHCVAVHFTATQCVRCDQVGQTCAMCHHASAGNTKLREEGAGVVTVALVAAHQTCSTPDAGTAVHMHSSAQALGHPKIQTLSAQSNHLSSRSRQREGQAPCNCERARWRTAISFEVPLARCSWNLVTACRRPYPPPAIDSHQTRHEQHRQELAYWTWCMPMFRKTRSQQCPTDSSR